MKTELENLLSHIEEGLKDEVQGKAYWEKTLSLLKAMRWSDQSMLADVAQAARDEGSHHSLLQSIKNQLAEKGSQESAEESFSIDPNLPVSYIVEGLLEQEKPLAPDEDPSRSPDEAWAVGEGEFENWRPLPTNYVYTVKIPIMAEVRANENGIWNSFGDYERAIEQLDDVFGSNLHSEIDHFEVECVKCEGSGQRDCEECDGTGEAGYDESGEKKECEECEGKGSKECEDCEGSGYRASRDLDFTDKLEKWYEEEDGRETIERLEIWDTVDNISESLPGNLFEEVDDLIKDDFNKIDMGQFLNQDVTEKIQSWRAEEFDGSSLITKVFTTEELTPEELAKMTEQIEGQCSDGWGDGFEQQNFGDYDLFEISVHSWWSEEDAYKPWALDISGPEKEKHDLDPFKKLQEPDLSMSMPDWAAATDTTVGESINRR